MIPYWTLLAILARLQETSCLDSLMIKDDLASDSTSARMGPSTAMKLAKLCDGWRVAKCSENVGKLRTNVRTIQDFVSTTSYRREIATETFNSQRVNATVVQCNVMSSSSAKRGCGISTAEANR